MTLAVTKRWADLTRREQREVLDFFREPISFLGWVQIFYPGQQPALEDVLLGEHPSGQAGGFMVSCLDVAVIVGAPGRPADALIMIEALPLSAKPHVIRISLTDKGRRTLYHLNEVTS